MGLVVEARKPKVVFLGSGAVAARSLELLAEYCQVEAVITKPSTLEEMKAIVSDKAPVHSVNDRQELDNLILNQRLESRVGILIDFGIIVSQGVIDYFPLGIVNSHFSLLPEWRGADPISFAILSGQHKTGVSLMLMVRGMDEGPILAQQALEIKPDDTGPTLTDSLIKTSDELLARNLPEYMAGRLIPRPQEQSGVSYSRKLTKSDGLINWQKPALLLEREIRAFTQWPKSRTQLGDIDVVITKAHASPNQLANAKPGDVKIAREAGVIMVATGEGVLSIEELKPVGKRAMTAKAFLVGYGNRLKI